MKWHAALLLCNILQVSRACTVYELTGAGFAANAVHVFHAYTLFAQNNGTLFLDSRDFEYKCDQDGGWQDFFSFDVIEGRLASYSLEQDQDELCARYTSHDVDRMLHTMGYDWYTIDVDAARQVGGTARHAAVAMPVLEGLERRPEAWSGEWQVWTFSSWVQHQVDPVLEEMAGMAAPRIAFHIRGGDKLSEDVELVRRPRTMA